MGLPAKECTEKAWTLRLSPNLKLNEPLLGQGPAAVLIWAWYLLSAQFAT